MSFTVFPGVNLGELWVYGMAMVDQYDDNNIIATPLFRQKLPGGWNHFHLVIMSSEESFPYHKLHRKAHANIYIECSTEAGLLKKTYQPLQQVILLRTWVLLKKIETARPKIKCQQFVKWR